jgi:DNA-directed RNA polymerase subunit H
VVLKFDHELVPVHIILCQEERDKLLERYGITIKELPKITLNDPIVKSLNAKPGDVIKIIRHSIAGQSEYYRVVISE